MNKQRIIQAHAEKKNNAKNDLMEEFLMANPGYSQMGNTSQVRDSATGKVYNLSISSKNHAECRQFVPNNAGLYTFSIKNNRFYFIPNIEGRIKLGNMTRIGIDETRYYNAKANFEDGEELE